MGFVWKMLNLQLELLTLILVGIFLRRRGAIDTKVRKCLSDLLINIILPCNIIRSFASGVSISSGFVRNCVLAVVISIFIQIFAIYASKFIFIRYPREKKNVMSYALICSNSSFVGLPVAEALYGSMGVLYVSVFQLPIRFTMWTSGLALFTTVDKKTAWKKLAIHPCIVSIFIGFALMLSPVKIPAFLSESIYAMSRCTMPFSMIVIGAILADVEVKDLFTTDVIYYSFVRLVAYPLFIYLILSFTGIDKLVINVAVVLSGMPAGSTTSILADKYDCDAIYAAKIILMSTVCSVFTIPMLGMLL